MAVCIAYSYVRFSGGNHQKKGTSLLRQTEDTVAGESPASWCRRHGVILDTSRTFHDLGKGAYSGHKQKELYAFLEMVRAGTIRPGSYLLVERIDRISRKGVDEGYDLCKKILKAGVFIVTLGNGRVYGPDAVKGLMKGALELQMYLEQAHEYSKALSARVCAAWEHKRKQARKHGTLATARMPPWLAAVGEREHRRAVVIPEKVAIVQRIFEMAAQGQGTRRILRTLLAEGVPPLTRAGWSQPGIHHLLHSRATLGEYQPRRGRDYQRAPDGPPLEAYYPAIITETTFQRAQACLGSRKRANVVRTSKLSNVFSGLLRDPATGGPYHTALRILHTGPRYHVLQSARKDGGNVTFPFALFEQALLGCLAEVDPREMLPPSDGPDEVLTLAAEHAALEARIAQLEAELDEGDVPACGVWRPRRRMWEAAWPRPACGPPILCPSPGASATRSWRCGRPLPTATISTCDCGLCCGG
jgi:DNA invertase Pin-like site-specific DNA recombinase